MYSLLLPIHIAPRVFFDKIKDENISVITFRKRLLNDFGISVQKRHIVIGKNTDISLRVFQNDISVFSDAAIRRIIKHGFSAVFIKAPNRIFSALISDYRIGLDIHFPNNSIAVTVNRNYQSFNTHKIKTSSGTSENRGSPAEIIAEAVSYQPAILPSLPK